MTNADRIRSMTDEELAAIIAADVAEGKLNYCQNKPECSAILETADGIISDEWCIQCALDWLTAETEGDGMSKAVREFLVDVAENEIISGKKYSCRIEIEDGGYNSYIGFNVDVYDYNRVKPITQGLRLFRHTNSTEKKECEWGFELGGVCDNYAEHPNIPIKFSSYDKTPDAAAAEAAEHFKELKRLIRKQTSEYKLKAAKSAQEEKEKLLERLKELEATP